LNGTGQCPSTHLNSSYGRFRYHRRRSKRSVTASAVPGAFALRNFGWCFVSQHTLEYYFTSCVVLNVHKTVNFVDLFAQIACILWNLVNIPPLLPPRNILHFCHSGIVDYCRWNGRFDTAIMACMQAGAFRRDKHYWDLS
jgi:hypothetical protein